MFLLWTRNHITLGGFYWYQCPKWYLLLLRSRQWRQQLKNVKSSILSKCSWREEVSIKHLRECLQIFCFVCTIFYSDVYSQGFKDLVYIFILLLNFTVDSGVTTSVCSSSSYIGFDVQSLLLQSVAYFFPSFVLPKSSTFEVPFQFALGTLEAWYHSS